MTARVGAQGIEVLYADVPFVPGPPPSTTARVGAQGIEVLYADVPFVPGGGGGYTPVQYLGNRRRRIRFLGGV